MRRCRAAFTAARELASELAAMITSRRGDLAARVLRGAWAPCTATRCICPEPGTPACPVYLRPRWRRSDV